MLQLRVRMAGLATALVLGATIVGLTAEPASAEKKKAEKDDGTRCAVIGAAVGTSNDLEFYMPGESYTDYVTGTKYVCGADGEWTTVEVTRRGVPGRLPSGTFTQTP